MSCIFWYKVYSIISTDDRDANYLINDDLDRYDISTHGIIIT